MTRCAFASLIIVGAWLPAAPASAFTRLDRAVAKKADAGPLAPLQVRTKHCKSKQSVCYTLRHNF